MGLPLTLTPPLDLSRTCDVIEARARLNRLLDRRDIGGLAEWARLFGHEALEIAQAASGVDWCWLKEALDNSEDECAQLEAELADAKDEIATLKAKVAELQQATVQ